MPYYLDLATRTIAVLDADSSSTLQASEAAGAVGLFAGHPEALKKGLSAMALADVFEAACGRDPTAWKTIRELSSDVSTLAVLEQEHTHIQAEKKAWTVGTGVLIGSSAALFLLALLLGLLLPVVAPAAVVGALAAIVGISGSIAGAEALDAATAAEVPAAGLSQVHHMVLHDLVEMAGHLSMKESAPQPIGVHNALAPPNSTALISAHQKLLAAV